MITAEIGVNFNGDRQRIPYFIRAAKDAGADAVKFQAYNTDKLIERRKITDAKTIDLLRRNELTDDDMALIRDTARNMGIKWFWSCFDPSQPARCVKFGACALKIGHAENDWGELRVACINNRAGLPVFISGGAGDEGHVVVTGTWEYPAKSLPKMGFIGLRYGHGGFSSHYADWHIPAAAGMRGARYIECHFKLADTDPEAAWSLSPEDFAKMVKQVREYESWL